MSMSLGKHTLALRLKTFAAFTAERLRIDIPRSAVYFVSLAQQN
jgi:hypothetical protein